MLPVPRSKRNVSSAGDVGEAEAGVDTVDEVDVRALLGVAAARGLGEAACGGVTVRARFRGSSGEKLGEPPVGEKPGDEPQGELCSIAIAQNARGENKT